MRYAMAVSRDRCSSNLSASHSRSPLAVGHLELLQELYSQVVVRRIVFDEIVVAGAGLTGAHEVEHASWLQVEDVPAEPSLLAMLDRGEAAAIPLAVRLGATLLADDARAREVARERGLVVIGTLGVLRWRRRKGYSLPSVQSSSAWRLWACLCRHSSAKQFSRQRLNPTVDARASVRL